METAREAVERAEYSRDGYESKEPVLESAWIASGTHVMRWVELANQARTADGTGDGSRGCGRVGFGGRRIYGSGDLMIPLASGQAEFRAVELSGIVAEDCRALKGGADHDFKSNGLAVQDVVAAAICMNWRARAIEGTQGSIQTAMGNLISPPLS